jgi:hypothetical protein
MGYGNVTFQWTYLFLTPGYRTLFYVLLTAFR